MNGSFTSRFRELDIIGAKLEVAIITSKLHLASRASLSIIPDVLAVMGTLGLFAGIGWWVSGGPWSDISAFILAGLLYLFLAGIAAMVMFGVKKTQHPDSVLKDWKTFQSEYDPKG
jgi:hypothetical protein